jgi:hypothetical protein
MPWPANFRAGTYPKYNGNTDPAQYIMSYQVAVASSGGDEATMAKSFIIALEGPALTWFTRLPPLSIDSWRSLRDKFLLNFQGYRLDTDALAELSLCKQLEKETLREYYRKFLTLKSQLPSVDDQIAIHYAINGLRASVLYSPRTSRNYISSLKNMPSPKSSTSARLSLSGNPKMLHSPAARGRGLRNQTPVETAAISSKCTTSPTSTPLLTPLTARSIPPRAAETEPTVGVGGVRSRHADSTIFFMAKTAPTKPKTAQKRRPPKTGWHGRSQPTTPELSRTLISNPLHYTSTPPPRIHRTTHTNTTRKYKSYLLHPYLHTSNIRTSLTPTPRNKKTSPISRIAESSI